LLDFLVFAAILLLLTAGWVAAIYYICKLVGWELYRRPVATVAVICLSLLLLVASFRWLFPGCDVAGIAYHGAAIVRCTR
jgi:hypothetical protein